MTIVSFNFTKIEAEKKTAAKGKINIKNNITIEKVEEKDMSLGNQKHKVLSFTFEFTSKYEDNFGHIRLIGNVLYMEDAKKVKEVLADWKKDKKLPKDITAKILNVVLNKSNVQALILSEQVNLPPPIPLPKVQIGPQKASS